MISFTDRKNTTTATVTGFLLGSLTGLLAGSTLGLLLAPHRGAVTRKKVKRKIDDARDLAEKKVEELKP